MIQYIIILKTKQLVNCFFRFFQKKLDRLFYAKTHAPLRLVFYSFIDIFLTKYYSEVRKPNERCDHMKMFKSMCGVLILALLLAGCDQSYIDLFPESPVIKPRESSAETAPESSTTQLETETMPDLTIEMYNDLENTVEIIVGVYDTENLSTSIAEAKFTTGAFVDEDTPIPLQKRQSYRSTIPGSAISACSGNAFFLIFIYTTTDGTTQTLDSLYVTKKECLSGEVFRVSTWVEEGKMPTIITQG